jgi:hypothetical protein
LLSFEYFPDSLNGSVYASGLKVIGLRNGYGLTALPFKRQSSTHSLAVLVFATQSPYTGCQKRHIQPEHYAKLGLTWWKK